MSPSALLSGQPSAAAAAAAASTSTSSTTGSSPRVRPEGPVPAGSRSPSRSPQPGHHQPSTAPESDALPTTLDPSVLRLGSSPARPSAAPAASSSSSSSAHQQPRPSRLHNLFKSAPKLDDDDDGAGPSSGTFSLSSSGGSSSGSTSILSSFFSALANTGSSSSSHASSSGSSSTPAISDLASAMNAASASSSAAPTPGGLGLSILADPDLDFDLGAESRRIVSSALADVDLGATSALLPSATLSEELSSSASIDPPVTGGAPLHPSAMTTTLPGTIDPAHLKKVKVYELRAEAWFDRGTGHVHGLYDEQADRALLVVTGEEVYNPAVDDERAAAAAAEGEHGAGGFVREEHEWGTVDVGEGGRKGRCLMMSFIQARDTYQKQQDTLVVWTEPDGVDIALSFADADDCDNVWEFILDVQKMLDSTRPGDGLALDDALYSLGSGSHNGSSSPPAPFGADDSPVPAHRQARRERARPLLPVPRLGAMREVLDQVRTFSRTVVGKERLVESVIKEDYLSSLILVFEEAEELESLEDLHALCEMMRAFLYTNEPHVLEWILQEDLFAGIVGMLEYDPEYPKLKASYREVLASSSNYREAVPIASPDVLVKIHQTYRLQFLKDVVLARSLEDATLSIINSIIFFNQNDIISYMQSETGFLRALFRDFGGPAAAGRGALPRSTGGLGEPRTTLASRFKRAGDSDSADDDDAVVPSSLPSDPPAGETDATPATAAAGPAPRAQTAAQFQQKRNVLLLLHSLLLMSKNIALTSRLALVRTLVDHGLVAVLKWAFSPAAVRPPPPPPAPSDDSDAVGPHPPSPPPADPDQISNAAIEILTHVLDHDPTAVRSVILRDKAAAEKAAGGEEDSEGGAPTSVTTAPTPTLVVEIVNLLVGTKPDGSPLTALRTQLAEVLKQLLDTGEGEGTGISRGPVKDGPFAEQFLTYFYDECISTLMAPLAALPDFKTLGGRPLSLEPDQAHLLLALTELLSFFVENHGHRSQYYVLSGSINTKVACLLGVRDKRLRHAAVRFFRACLKINTHFVHRWLNKGDVFAPILALLSQEASADNMLCSACLELFEHVRKENIRSILDGIMDSHGDDVRQLARRPVLRICFEGLVTRWEQNHEPPPIVAPEPKAAEEELKRRSDRAEEDYFGGSDDESPASTSQVIGPPQRKRQRTNPALGGKTPSSAIIFTSAGAASPSSSSSSLPAEGGASKGLDLGYDDSDSDDDMKDGPPTPAPAPGDDAVADMELDPADAIEDVARQMSEKRRREEEDDDADGGFGRLVGPGPHHTPSTGGPAKGAGHKRMGGFSGGVGQSSSDSLRKLSGGASASAPADGSLQAKAADDPPKPEAKLKFSLKSFKFGGGGGGGSK